MTEEVQRNEPRDFDPAKFEYTLTEDGIYAEITKIQEAARELSSNKDEIKKLITFIDLTTLSGDDTAERVTKLYDRALHPIPKIDAGVYCAATCTYPARVAEIKNHRNSINRIESMRPKIASVAAGFPSGQYHLESRVLEVQLTVRDGAEEIDIVLNRALALEGKWNEVYAEVAALRKACGDAHMKTILAVGELKTKQNVFMASQASIYAGSDFIKTSTGKETINANLVDSFIMCTAIKQYFDATGIKIGFKPAGGIKTFEQGLEYVSLVRHVLGEDWCRPKYFRIGASSLLDSVIKALA